MFHNIPSAMDITLEFMVHVKEKILIIGRFDMDHIMDTICKMFHYSPNCTQPILL